jgi:hypothetical protein
MTTHQITGGFIGKFNFDDRMTMFFSSVKSSLAVAEQGPEAFLLVGILPCGRISLGL